MLSAFILAIVIWFTIRILLRFFFDLDIKVELVELAEESDQEKIVEPDPKDLDENRPL